jgi:hypothetical protein
LPIRIRESAPPRLAALAAAGAGLIVLSACATSRGILPIEVPAAVPIEGPAAAKSSPAYRIDEVRDVRVFERAPARPSIPSLKGGEIDDAALTARAIARKRNTYGKALGDILLPDGDSVAGVTRRALVRALRESGLRVVEEGDAEWAEARPVSAEVRQFWAWLVPGFWALTLNFEMQVLVRTDLGSFRDGVEIAGAAQRRPQTAGTGAWRNTIDQGLEDFDRNLKAALERELAAQARGAQPD